MWLHSLKVAQLLRSAACLHTNQSRSYLNHLVFSNSVLGVLKPVNIVGREHSSLKRFAPEHFLHRICYFPFIEDAIAILINGTNKLRMSWFLRHCLFYCCTYVADTFYAPKISLCIQRSKLSYILAQESIDFPQILVPPQNSRCQKGDMKQVSERGPANGRRHRTEVSLLGDLAHGVCALLP